MHLVVPAAIKNGWTIEHYALENCDPALHTAIENQRKLELKCDLNDGASWLVEDFAKLAETLK